MADLRIGRHYNGGGSKVLQALQEAHNEGATAMQVFASGRINRTIHWPSEGDTASFLEASTELYKSIHAAYVLNICQPPESDIYQRSCAYLEEVLRWGEALGFHSVVVHPSSAKEFPVEEAELWCAQAVTETLIAYRGPVQLLLENSAGDQRDRLIGRDPAQLDRICSQIATEIDPARFGICLDTTHAYAGGYPVAEILEWRDYPWLRMLHLNSPKPEVELGSKKDRHGNFQEGGFSEEELKRLVGTFAVYPIIMESNPPSAEEVHQALVWAHA